MRGRTAVRARVMEPVRVPGWLVGLTAAALGLVCAGMGAGAAFGQSQPVPEVVRPRSDSPTLPPTPGSGTTPPTTSVAPQVDGGGARPIPDTGVIQPPATGQGSPAVIRPPATGTMPVIPPPGTPGGERAPVPK